MATPPPSARPVWAEIHLGALRHNLAQVRSLLQPGTELLAVVKANAYGHGMERIATALREHGVTRFGCASLEEALRLRSAGITDEILILGYSDPAVSAEIIAHGIIQTVGSTEQVAGLVRAAREVGLPARVHVKLDTGMTRLGAPAARAPEVLYQAMAHPEVTCKGIYTHFHSADLPQQPPTPGQWAAFQQILQPMRKILGGIQIHAANTAALINYPDTQADLVRIGIGLYGGYPSVHVPRALDLKPVMSLKTRVVEVKRITPGTGVGYNHQHVALSEETIAILPVGYADGIVSQSSTAAQVLIRGMRCPVAGRISMDFCAVRVPEGTSVSIGDEAVLLGAQGADSITLDEYADWMHMVPYEPLCLVGPRVIRHYLNG